MNSKISDLEAKVVLLVKFGMSPIIPLRDIADEYLGMSFNTALKKARLQALPLPVFRMGESQKADWVVSLDDLAELITHRADQARAEWQDLRNFAFRG